MWDRDGPHIEASEYIHVLVPHRPPHCMHDLSAPPPPTTTTKDPYTPPKKENQL
jgi:hypothetical protein